MTGRVERRDADRTAIVLLFEATNACQVDAALARFAADAIIDDPAVGRVFEGKGAIAEYLRRFFVGYRTVTTIRSMATPAPGTVDVRTDFTGTFGQEVGILRFTFDDEGSIRHLHADLEG